MYFDVKKLIYVWMDYFRKINFFYFILFLNGWKIGNSLGWWFRKFGCDGEFEFNSFFLGWFLFIISIDVLIRILRWKIL